MNDDTEILYVRIPGPVKRKLRRYAERNSLSLAAASGLMLARGLKEEAADRRRERDQ